MIDSPPLRPAAAPGRPEDSGYAETRREDVTAVDRPDPEADGSQRAQTPGAVPGDEEHEPGETEETPPGENKREPIKDPDPADTKLHVKPARRQ